ncbi:MAG: NAD(P)-dependent alcohol dehydrogenase, partial [Anaerolineae bacterium]|nr:NAD(P)-dependent alcohol dehydrogenase [Anaerolineae bacterium]
FHVGDAVYGDLSGWRWGGYAEYVSVPEKLLARMPATLSFEQAAGVPEAAVVALQGLRDLGKLQAGEEVLIQGASGGIGTFAVQIAKAMGAVVTAVCSTRNVELVRGLGADHVIDYTREDFTQNGKLYDLILATVGYRPILEYRRSLAADGVYVATGGTLRQIFESLLLGPLLSRGGKRLANLLVRPNAADLAYVAQLIDSGQMKPVIDRMYPLEETAAAIKYYEEGRSRGKVIIQVQASEGV